MNSLLTAVASAVLLLGATQAGAVVVVYTATLNGPSEAPPVASPGYGLAIVTIDDVPASMRVQTTFVGLFGTTTVAHIHCCTSVPLAGTAGVATPTPTFPGFPAGVSSGFYDVTFDMTLPGSYNPAYITANGGTAATAFAALNSGLLGGRGYLNIHSTFAPAGEIRGFLTPNTPVPEPETYALLLSGLGVIGFMARRRRQG